MWQGNSKDPHQHRNKMAQVCRNSCGASFRIHVQPRAEPAAGLSLGVPGTGATHFTGDQGVRSRTARLRMEYFGPNRAEQEDECLKLMKFSFSPVDQGLQYVSPSFCVRVCMQLFPLLVKHTHIYLLQYPTYTLHKQSISTSWMCYRNKLSSIKGKVVRPC